MFKYEPLDVRVITKGVLHEVDYILANGWKRNECYPILRLGVDQIPWKLEDNTLRSWNFHLHSWDMLNLFLHSHSMTGKARYLEIPIAIIDDWLDHNSDLANPVSPMAWYDMAVGVRAYRLAYTLEAAEDLLSAEQKEKYWLSLLQHAEWLADDANIAFHTNHGFYQAAGQLAMARRFIDRHPAMVEAWYQAKRRIIEMMQRQFNVEGVHREHSPFYHYMVLTTLKGILESGLVDEPEIWEAALKIETNLSWLVMPNFHLLTFGDSDDKDMTCEPTTAKSKFFTPELHFLASNGAIGAAPPSGTMAFPEAGYWISRHTEPGAQFREGSYLALNAAFHSRVHKHADHLSICWYDHGEPILIDAGRYGYHGRTKPGSELFKNGFWYADPRRIYCESTRAHNTLEFDGKDFPRTGIEPFGSALVEAGTSEGIDFAVASCEPMPDISFTRTLFFSPGKWLLVMDNFNDRKKLPHGARQWFHLGGDIQTRPLGDQLELHLAGGSKLICVPLLAGAALQPVQCGVEQPQMQGWWSPNEGVLVPAPAFNFRVPQAPGATIATLFCFGDEASADIGWNRVNATARKGRFKWTVNNLEYTLEFDRMAGQTEISHASKEIASNG